MGTHQLVGRVVDPLGLRASGLTESVPVHLSSSADPLGLATAGLSGGGGQARDAAEASRSGQESPNTWPSDAKVTPAQLTLPISIHDTVGAYDWHLFE